jgi:nucleoside-diphosphate-sugar epimerase
MVARDIMKVLLTGDKGRIGRRTRPLLEADGHEVVGFDKVDDFYLRKANQIDTAATGCDVIIHLAAIPHPQKGSIEDYFRTNVEGTLNVLKAAVKNEVKRVVYSSSTGYYGCDTNIHGVFRPRFLPIDETHPPATAHQQFYGWLSAYNQSKVMAEQLIAWYGTNEKMQTVALRIGPANSKAEQYPKPKALAHLKRDDWRLMVMLANCHPDYAAKALALAADLNIELPDWSVFNIVDRYLPSGITPQMMLTLFGIETDRTLFCTKRAEEVLGWEPCEER